MLKNTKIIVIGQPLVSSMLSKDEAIKIKPRMKEVEVPFIEITDNPQWQKSPRQLRREASGKRKKK